MAITRRTLSVLALWLPIGCAGRVERSPVPPRIPLNHRAADAGCPTARAAVHSTPVECGNLCGFFGCTQDSDCAQGSNGRCGLRLSGVGLECSYDECSSDSDCSNGSRCECRPTADSAVSNACTLSNCSFDAECGPGGYCSPSQYMHWCPSFHACHTPNDVCTDDADCTSSAPDGARDTCNFDQSKQHWTCNEGCGPRPK
jgi:hypothetical protein